MTKAELGAGFKRLYDGFSRSQVDLTPERMDALFKAIGFYSAEIWNDAVQELLCEARFPDFDGIEAAIDRAAEAHRLAENARADADAKRFLSGQLTPGFDHRDTDHEYGLMRLKVLTAVTLGATPQEVAAMLESQAGRYDGYGLREEAARYRAMPHWGDALERPTWWERQQAKSQAEHEAKERDLIASVRGMQPPDETWPGWGALGYDPQAEEPEY